MKLIGFVVIVVWLVIGGIAVNQKEYLKRGSHLTCNKVGTVSLTILAGPLNYAGVNPKVQCHRLAPAK